MKRKDQKVKHRDKKKTGFEELSGKWQLVEASLYISIFPLIRVTCMTDDLPSPHRPVHLLAHSQSSTFQVVSKRTSILFSVVLSSVSLVYPFSTLSSVCVLHLPSSHARTCSTVSP